MYQRALGIRYQDKKSIFEKCTFLKKIPNLKSKLWKLMPGEI